MLNSAKLPETAGLLWAVVRSCPAQSIGFSDGGCTDDEMSVDGSRLAMTICAAVVYM